MHTTTTHHVCLHDRHSTSSKDSTHFLRKPLPAPACQHQGPVKTGATRSS